MFRTVIAIGIFAWAASSGRAVPAPPTPRIATTANDFRQPGTQPDANTFAGLTPSLVCATCHGGFVDGDAEIADSWTTSMMAQAARDPLMRAAAAVAAADAGASTETCIRCHAPIGWLQGRSSSGSLDALEPGDRDGVTCDVCHRLVDPIARAGAPASDAAILGGLESAGVRPHGICTTAPAQPCIADSDCGEAGACRIQAGQGRFVIDPADSRRGPRDLSFHIHTVTASPLHTRADACAPCHDVSTATYTRQSDGSYSLNALDAPHPSQDPDDMFPEQRTYSEWRASAFATGGVVFPDGRFGGARTVVLPNTVPVSTCQDCHMPTLAVSACVQAGVRPDVGSHGFAGANSWVLDAIRAEYPAESGLTAETVASARARAGAMLAAAADIDVQQAGYVLTVRVTNETGHKLPTGYPEGRRMWLAVRYFTGADTTPIAEDGAYDDATATLDVAHTTKVWEVRQTIDAAVGTAAGLPPGTPFHLALSNVVALDNRIPPRGFSRTAFDTFGGAPVGTSYADGQHWDDTSYRIPDAATRVEVSLYHQTTTREYAEFLRDADAAGQNAYDRWVAAGRSAPVLMGRVTRELIPICGPEGASCDADACTPADVCHAGACVTGPSLPCCSDSLVGFAALDCVYAGLTTATVCPDRLPRGFKAMVAQRVRQARARTNGAERKRRHGGSAAAVQRLLDAGTRQLRALDTRIEAATTAKPTRRISAKCAEALRSLSARGQTVAAGGA